MEKLSLHSDLTARNVENLAALFPHVITESIDADGKPARAIDFDLLRQELSNELIEGPQERYQLDWPGKRAALFAANAPIAKTLRPVREGSLNFDETKNLFIEGDNLDALKLLHESYLGKVRLIYIDPPYNTGNDFVYDDDFAESTAEFLKRSGQVASDGTRLVANLESNGRFHSGWLSMMYPRLKLARNLLADDGFLFVSIDDGEAANLRHLCDEIFGAANFVCAIMWKRKREISNDSKNVAIQGEYILAYSRSAAAQLKLEPLSANYLQSSYKDATPDFPDGRWRGVPLTVSKGLQGGGYTYSVVSPSGKRITRLWAYPEERFERLRAAGRVYWGKDGSAIPQRVIYAHESMGQPTSNYWSDTSSNKEGKRAILDLFGDAVFDTAKPVPLLERIVRLATDSDSIVLDFFAGAASTAHAVLSVNAADGGTRRFLLVQIAEEVAPNTIAAANGYRTIADIARERIIRVGKQIRVSNGSEIDIGFRLLRVDTTNLNDLLRTPDDLDQASLALFTDSVKPDRSEEDLLFQVILSSGLDLSLRIEAIKLDEQRVFLAGDDALIACFAASISTNVVEAIAERRPRCAVFRDSGFATDADRINAVQIFAERSPATDLKTI